MDNGASKSESQERPVIAYYGNMDHRRFFRQNSATGGTYLECWIRGREFAHVLVSVDQGSPEQLKTWIESLQLQLSTVEEYESHFFQLCREIESKREMKNQERQSNFKS